TFVVRLKNRTRTVQGACSGSSNRDEQALRCSVRFGSVRRAHSAVRFGSVWYEQRWIQFVFVLFSQFIRSSRMFGKLYVPGKKCAELVLHNIIPNHTEHEPNTNRTLGATVRFGSCSP